MEDNKIIQLYFERNEDAIAKTSDKYGRYLNVIANNVLNDEEDTKECVNDTYLKAWNVIPPQIPQNFKIFLGRITRNLAIDKYRNNHAKKRYDGMTVLLSELDECIMDRGLIEEDILAKELAEYINIWLSDLKEKQRVIFVKRFWYGHSVEKIATSLNMRSNSVSVVIKRLKTDLANYLANKI